MNHSQVEKLGLETLKWLRRRNDENLVLFYSNELKKILVGADADLLLTGRERRRLKQAGIITYNRGEGPIEILPWAVDMLTRDSKNISVRAP